MSAQLQDGCQSDNSLERHFIGQRAAYSICKTRVQGPVDTLVSGLWGRRLLALTSADSMGQHCL